MSSFSNNSSNHNPWLSSNDNGTTSDKKFDDDFVKASYQPLADSNQYLASLEKKLSKLKNVSKPKNKNDLVKAVESTWDSYMVRVIESDSREQLNLNQDSELEASLTPNSIITRINPEQALTIGELAELVKNDTLSIAFEKPDSDRSQ